MVIVFTGTFFMGPVSTYARCGVTFQGLGTLPDHVASFGLGISGDGRVVVGESFDRSGVPQAFRWTAGTGMVGLGTLPNRPGSLAQAVNRDGSVIVGTGRFFDERKAFRWTEATGLQPVTPADATPRALTAAGISASGSVIAGAAAVESSSPQVYRWTEAGGIVSLGFLSSQSGNDERWGVSADGSVIAGVTVDEGGNDRAFRWTADAGMVALPLIADAIKSGAFGISARGDVIVGFNGFPDNGREATLWNPTGARGLGKLPGDFLSVALKTSQDGSVVVGSSGNCLGCPTATAFIWYEKQGMFNLRDVLVSAGLFQELQGWVLVEPNGISADGHVVSGIGINPSGREEAFIATVCGQIEGR